MPEIRLDDTIAAIATPVGEGGISVIRLSGPQAFEIAGSVFFPQKGRLADFSSHTIHVGQIRNEKGVLVDQGLASLFRTPHSYTAEDVIEISSHGGLVVTHQVLNLLIQKGARHAEPGEFTKRAFLNGKIDLTQAEAVLDLIRAKSERSVQAAVDQLRGSLSARFKALKDDLLKMYAHMEAFLDFPDEHLEVYSDQDFAKGYDRIGRELETLIASFRRGVLLREGICAVLVGKPNVGKSSLFNALLARDRALVSEFPGTTRDALEEMIEIDGILIRLVDTAGLGSAAGHPLERLGMEKTRQTLESAQLFLYLVDASASLEDSDRLVFEEIRQSQKGQGPKPVLVLVNKSDLPFRLDLEALAGLTGEKNPLRISTKTREGLDQLEKAVRNLLWEGPVEKNGQQVTRLRHKNALEQALEALKASQAAFQRQESLDMVILDLKRAVDSLRELIGEVYSEDLLDVIFSEFCIGK